MAKEVKPTVEDVVEEQTQQTMEKTVVLRLREGKVLIEPSAVTLNEAYAMADVFFNNVRRQRDNLVTATLAELSGKVGTMLSAMEASTKEEEAEG
jgi:hypothetical protein